MTSLHIFHTVRDFDSWLATFNTFDDFRTSGGVKTTTVRRGIENPDFVAVDIEFDDAERARSFLTQLETQVWPNSPHLEGRPTVHLLEAVTASV
jgi:hypothetical protein